MKRFTLSIIAGLVVAISYGQESKDLTLSFSTGWLTSPYYENAKARSYYSVDFDYHLAQRHVLSANFNSGKHNYYDKILSNVPALPEIPTNAEAAYLTFSILYKYKFLNGKKVSAHAGAGAGIMTHINEYQYWEPNRGDVRQSSWTGIVFPVRLDAGYQLFSRLHLGITGGLLIHPDYSLLAYYAGPRLSYVLK